MSAKRSQTTTANPIEGPALQHQPALLTTDEATELLRVSRSTVYEYVRDGRVPASRIGRKAIIARSSLEQALAMRKEDR